MNILLINFEDIPTKRNPIALLDIASYCRKLGYGVVCKYTHTVTELDFRNAEVVGLSCIHPPAGTTPVEYANKIAVKYDRSVVVGGKWAKGNPKCISSDDRVTLSTDDGEVFFGGDSLNLSQHPPWDIQDFESLQNVRVEIMSSRGCPYHCHFCNNTEKQVRFFSVQRTVDNIQTLISLGITNIFIVDDVFTIKPGRMKDILTELLDRRIDIRGKVRFFSHIKYINEKSIRVMKEYDPQWVELGIESGDDHMLLEMGKAFNSCEAQERLSILASTGIRVAGLFLIGFPGETQESLENTFQFVQRTRRYYHHIHVSMYQPIIGTIGYERAVRRMPAFAGSKRNSDVTYIDPNLTSEMLQKYRAQILSGKV